MTSGRITDLRIPGQSPDKYNTIHVPPGQRINLILSDNTNLWLNANTTFRYPTKFSKETRTVYLDGEAYFEVSKNEKKPFIVKTAQGDIHVTGTLFNVEAYSKHHSFETSLFEGGVDIYKGDTMLATLYPNQNGTLKNGQFFLSLEYQAQFYAKCLAMRTTAKTITFISPYDGTEKTITAKCISRIRPTAVNLYQGAPQLYKSAGAVFEEV